MDNGFRTLGECEFGTVWFVEGEGKIVVNAFQAAMYFSAEDFEGFARMVADAKRKLSGDRAPAAPPPAPSSSKIRQFRPNPDQD